MPRRLIASAAVLLIGVAACKSSTAPEPQNQDTFSTNTFSSYTAYTLQGTPQWSIANGMLIGGGPTNQGVLIRNGVQMANGWVEAVSTRADDGGLVLRFVSPDDYYMLAFRDDSAQSPRDVQNLAIYHHIPDGEYREMWDLDVAWKRGTPATIRFEANANQLNVYFNGAQVGQVTPSPQINDPSPSTAAGGVGVRNYARDATWAATFDTFRWGAL